MTEADGEGGGRRAERRSGRWLVEDGLGEEKRRRRRRRRRRSRRRRRWAGLYG